MEYSISVFHNLITKYTSWDKIRVFLESEEGGMFKIGEVNDREECIITYEKGVSNMSLDHSRWFRSVVWNISANLPICVAPPKVSSDPSPLEGRSVKDMIESDLQNKMLFQEYLDGFMINCYMTNTEIKNIYVVSRSKFNATGSFYSQKSFKTLFYDALYSTDSSLDKENDEGSLQKYISTITDINFKDDEYAKYISFHVQHPENRFVTNISEPKLFHVQTCVIKKDGMIHIQDSNTLPRVDLFENLLNEQMSCQEHIAQYCKSKSWQFQGIVCKDKNGGRWRYRSDEYNVIRSLRGNTPVDLMRYLQLRAQNLTALYLQYYPEDIVQFSIFDIQVSMLCQVLYNLYTCLHIRKIVYVNNINKMYLPHLYSLHGYYISKLRPDNKSLVYEDVMNYVNKLPWQRIIFMLNRAGDNIINESD